MLYIPEVSAKFMDLSHDILKVGQLSIKGKTERFLKEKKKEKNLHSENWKNDDVMLTKGQ